MSALPAVRAEGLTPGVAEAYALQAVEAIDRVSTPDEAEQLLQQVRMAEQAVRIAEIGRVFEQRWTRVRLQAERKYGELLGPAEIGRPEGNVTGGHVVAEERKERQRARAVAAVPEPVFNAYITEAQQPSRAGLLRAAKEPEVASPEPAASPASSWTSTTTGAVTSCPPSNDRHRRQAARPAAVVVLGYDGPAPRAVCRRAIIANGTGWLDQLQQVAAEAPGVDA